MLIRCNLVFESEEERQTYCFLGEERKRNTETRKKVVDAFCRH